MSIEIESIAFNHTVGSQSADAMNVRRNGSQALLTPEWQRGVSSTAQDAPAVYSIADTTGHTITIHVTLRRLRRDMKKVEVRALDMNAGGGCLYSILVGLGLGDWIQPRTGGLLGSVDARRVPFGTNGQTGPLPFTLSNHRLQTSGVDTDIVLWRWQYREGHGAWTDIGVTQHEAFSVLASPTAPWVAQPLASADVLWTDLLRYACDWARGAQNANEAAAAVTRAVYALGAGTVTYDCPGGGSSNYSWGAFDLSAFLDRLNGGVGNGVYVNCSDCATFVSTVANALGADLWQSRMGYGFALNPLLAIGSNVWQTACGWGSFSYHEVAWKGACTATERIYDACLQVDNDSNPAAPPQSPLLPQDMRFGNAGDGDYRDKLSPSGNCSPQPTTRQRRALV